MTEEAPESKKTSVPPMDASEIIGAAAVPASSAAATAEEEDDFVLTPEIMRYENGRTDLVLAIGVLFYAFFLGSFKETGADFWLRQRNGQVIAQTFPNIPQVDDYSYTAAGKPWINPSWLFDWGVYELDAAIGPRALVVVKSLVAVLVALVLLSIRHRGPTLWWSTLVTLLALTAMSARFSVSPELVTMLLWAILLWIGWRATQRGNGVLLYASVPIAILWANIDATTLPLASALLFLIAIGNFLPPSVSWNLDQSATSTRSLGFHGFIAGILCVLAGAATPFHIGTLTFAYDWFVHVLGNVSDFEKASTGWNRLGPDFFQRLTSREKMWDSYAWIALIAFTVIAMTLNAPRFRFSRLFLVLFAVSLPLLASRLMPFSSLLLAAQLAVNGQEFYLAHWGVTTRIDRGWILWSQGGRALSIIVVFCALFAGFTGSIQGMTGRFGHGIVDERYPTKSVDWLKKSAPKGRHFAFVDRIAGAIAWQSPEIKNFADSRWQVFHDILKKFSLARGALRDDEPTSWKPIFDPLNVTHVIIDPQDIAMRTARPGKQPAVIALLNSPLFQPLYIDDDALIFGRTDDTIDKEKFGELRIRSNQTIFREQRQPPPGADRFAESPGVIDAVWRTRTVLPKGCIAGIIYASGARSLEQPGANYEAVHHLRSAIADNPDSPEAYYQLGSAYGNIYGQEFERMAIRVRDAIAEARAAETKRDAEKSEAPKATPPAEKTAAPTPAKAEAAKEEKKAEAAKVAKDVQTVKADKEPELASDAKAAASKSAASKPTVAQNRPTFVLPPSHVLFPVRHYQMMSAFQNAVVAGDTQGNAHLKLAELCLNNEFFDLSLHHFDIAVDRLPKPAGEIVDQRYQLEPLRAMIQQRRAEYDSWVSAAQKKLEQAGVNSDFPLERAMHAFQMGLPKLAVEQLENISALELPQAAPFASRLYLLLGYPEKSRLALDAARRQLQLAPGEWHWMMTNIAILAGQYKEAVDFLEHALAEVRRDQLIRSMTSLRAVAMTGGLLAIPIERAEIFGGMEREADYRFNLAMLRMEMGDPKKALEDFRELIRTQPHFRLRPVIELYWPLLTDDKIPPEPPLPKPDPSSSAPSAEKIPETKGAKPAEPKPAATKSETKP